LSSRAGVPSKPAFGLMGWSGGRQPDVGPAVSSILHLASRKPTPLSWLQENPAIFRVRSGATFCFPAHMDSHRYKHEARLASKARGDQPRENDVHTTKPEGRQAFHAPNEKLLACPVSSDRRTRQNCGFAVELG
jgi:hypothetical protein